jgi:serine/threonine protein kinase
MLGISWSESPSLGRFWPQIILEAAHQGNLAEYLSYTDIGFNSKLAISSSIGMGLQFLHAHRVIHADLKPTNILIFNRNENASSSAGLEPIQPRICDFGYAVILDDYGPGALFKARLGTPTWMAPEIDAETPIELDNLHKADIYSFGLLVASILMDSRAPFGDLKADEVSISKTIKPEDEASAVATILRNIKATTEINNLQEEFIGALLAGACAPLPSERVSLSAIHKFTLLGLHQDLARGEALYPLRWFQVFDYTDCGYMYGHHPTH